MERLKKKTGLFLFVFIQILFFVFPFSIGKASNGFEDCWANINNLYEQFVIILFYIFFLMHNIVNYKIYRALKNEIKRIVYIKFNISLFILFYFISYVFYFYTDGGSNDFIIIFYFYTVIYFSVLIYNLTIKKIKINKFIYSLVIFFSSILIFISGVFIINNINYNEKKCNSSDLFMSSTFGDNENLIQQKEQDEKKNIIKKNNIKLKNNVTSDRLDHNGNPLCVTFPILEEKDLFDKSIKK